MINILKFYLNLSYKNISDEKIDYMIEDILRGNGCNYTDSELINIIKAFCFNQIKSFAPLYDIEVLSSEMLDKRSSYNNTYGLTTVDKIYLNEELLLKIRNLDLNILRTVFHEATHVYQRTMIDSNEISYKVYLLIMEQIIINETNKSYLEDNYNYFYEEIDARTQAEFKLFDYLKEHNAELINNEMPNILKNIKECEDDAEVLFRKINDRKYDREELLDRIMLKFPEYKTLYPILNLYYNDDGSKILLGDIIKRDRENPESIEDTSLAYKVKKLDKFIIANRRGSKKNLRKDLFSLLKLELINEEEIQMVNEVLPKLYDYIEGNFESDSLNELYNILVLNINRLKLKVGSCKNVAYQYSYKFMI